MWVYLPQGMVSIVADKQAPKEGRLLVRARSIDHLWYFRNLMPEGHKQGPVLHTPNADYSCRMWASRAQVQAALAKAVQIMTQTNFKASIKDSEYAHAAHAAWAGMYDFQHGRLPAYP